MVKAKKWIMESTFHGKLKQSDFKLLEEEIDDDLIDGEVLCEALYLSVDPYMRLLEESNLKPGDTINGTQVARITKSKNAKFPKDSLVLFESGWRTHTVVTDEDLLTPLGYLDDQPPSLALGILGMPGALAYFGILESGNIKAGETVVVNCAAGATGNLVGQIAKIKGCKVIGFAGSDAKCKWLEECGFDRAFNYKTVDLDKAYNEVVPEGIDCYYDCVGGEFSYKTMFHMRRFGRVVLVGWISSYNDDDSISVYKFPCEHVVENHISMLGVNVYNWIPRYKEAFAVILQWIKEGKVKYKETITEGFENMPQAFAGLFEGKNFGKALVKV